MFSHPPQFSSRIRVSILIGLVILTVGGIFLIIQRVFTANTTTPTISYCDLVRDPMRYDQATIRIRATHVVGFEWSYLMDNNCTDKTWTILAPEDPACSVDVPKSLLPVDRHGGTRSVTVVGRFYGERRGYGHLGQYPYMFNVICVEKAGPFIPWKAP